MYKSMKLFVKLKICDNKTILGEKERRKRKKPSPPFTVARLNLHTGMRDTTVIVSFRYLQDPFRSLYCARINS